VPAPVKVSGARGAARELALLRAIDRWRRERGEIPSQRDLCDETDIPTVSMVSWYLERLAARGWLACGRSRGGRTRGARALCLTPEGFRAIGVEPCGCGCPFCGGTPPRA